MTVVVVPLDPPAEALPRLPETAPVDADEAATLARAMAADACRAVADSGGDLLVNYPDPTRTETDDPEAAARELVAEAGIDPDATADTAVEGAVDVRFEVQVGSSFAARVGNAVTHLLDREDASTAAVLTPDAPLVAHTEVDTAAMRLRRHDIVLGPAERGRVYYAGFTEPVDFTDAFAPPAIETLAARAAGDGWSVDFLPQFTRVATGDDLYSVVAALRAREAASRPVPGHTAAAIDELGLGIEGDRLVR